MTRGMSVVRCMVCSKRVLQAGVPVLARYASTSVPSPRTPLGPSSTKPASRPLRPAPKPLSSAGPRSAEIPKAALRPGMTPSSAPPRPGPSKPARVAPLPPRPRRPITQQSSARAADEEHDPLADSKQGMGEDDIENRSFLQSLQRLNYKQWYLVGASFAGGAALFWLLDTNVYKDRDEKVTTILDRPPDIQKTPS